MGDPVEVELKLEYSLADRERLIASAPLQAASATRHQLVATYFDTPDRRLDKAGYALRVRSDGSRHVQTLKASASAGAGLFVRGEWERDVLGNQPIVDDESGPLLQSLDADALAMLAPLVGTNNAQPASRFDLSAALVEHRTVNIDGYPRGVDYSVYHGIRSDKAPGQAILANQQGGSIEAQPVYDTLHEMDLQLYRKVWNRIRQFWTAEQWVRVTDENGKALELDPTLLRPVRAETHLDLDAASADALYLELYSGKRRVVRRPATRRE